MYRSLQDAITDAERQGVSLAALALQTEARDQGRTVESIRDARKRFRIDSDRVFLAGHGEGGNAAFDIGMSRPDLFAGVIPGLIEEGARVEHGVPVDQADEERGARLQLPRPDDNDDLIVAFASCCAEAGGRTARSGAWAGLRGRFGGGDRFDGGRLVLQVKDANDRVTNEMIWARKT